MANSYTNPGGSGSRPASIIATSTAVAGTGTPSTLVNGAFASAYYWNAGQSGREVGFDFGAARNITEAKWYQNSSGSHGTWKWQGSNDASAWTDIGAAFTLGGVNTQTITELSVNTNTWRYYRMLQTAGTTSSGPYLYEIEFNIDAGPTPVDTAWNPADKTAGCTLSDGNLVVTWVSGNNGVRSAHSKASGKYYWEYTFTGAFGTNTGAGVANASANLGTLGAATNGCMVFNTGNIYVNGTNTGVSLGSIANGSSISVAWDAAAQLIWYRKIPAGNWNGSGTANPATVTGGVSISGLGSPLYALAAVTSSSDVLIANFGDRAFVDTVPSGFTSGFPLLPPPNDARVTQVSLEQFAKADPPAQVTSVSVEMWATTATITGQALVTTVALEMWAQNPPAGRAKVWNGSTWTIKPVKVWSGAAWVTKPVKIWNGTTWA